MSWDGMRMHAVSVEALEPRQFLSGTSTGAVAAAGHITASSDVHQRFRHHYHQHLRHHFHLPHTVTPDALVGHFEGTYTGNIPSGNGPVSLTFTKNSAGDFGGALSMAGLNFDKVRGAVYSDERFILSALISGQGGILFSGSIQTSAGGMTLTGTYLGTRMSDLFQGTFSLKKIA